MKFLHCTTTIAMLASLSGSVYADTTSLLKTGSTKAHSFLSQTDWSAQSLPTSLSSRMPACRSTHNKQCPDNWLNETVERNATKSLQWSGQVLHGGHHSDIDDYAAELPKNLRVIFILETMENVAVSGGGINTVQSDTYPGGIWSNWKGNSTAATVERYNDAPGETGTVGLPLPGPDEIWPIDHNNVLYDALVHDGCGNVPVFPIEWNSTVIDAWDASVVLGEFQAYDDSTLTPNGYWNFHYMIRAMDAGGAESNFFFNGKVRVECTILEDYQY